MIVASSSTTVEGERYEYTTQPTDGVSLATGDPWWGTFVKYRKAGTRRWKRFNAVDVHSWEVEKLKAMIAHKETSDVRL